MLPALNRTAVVTQGNSTRAKTRIGSGSRYWILALPVFCAVALTIQVLMGAYSADLAGYPDESAHAVTGIALEQYLVHGLGQSPVRFLLDYYEHYPKVAIGHWPPLLYVAEVAAMLPFSPSKAALLGLQAVLAGLLAWIVFRELRRVVGGVAGAVGAVALLLNPQVRAHTAMTMAEILLTLTMLLATLALARFAERRSTWDAVWFALWTAAAVLTKGTGWAMLLAAAFVVVVLREWRLPFSRAALAGGAVLAALCVPWQLATLKVASEGWARPVPGVGFFLEAAPLYLGYLFTVPGIALAVAGLAGAALTLGAGRSAGRTRAYWAALTGLVVAAWLFHVVVPAGEEPRKLIIMVPAMMLLAAAGARVVSTWLFTARPEQGAAVLFCGVALAAIGMGLPLETKPRLGFVAVAAKLDSLMKPGSAALVISDAFGEGALTAELAFRRPMPAVYLVRGSKLLASQNWDASRYVDRVHSAEECARVLASVPISVLVVDRRSGVGREHYFDYVDAMLRNDAAEWTPANPEQAQQGIFVYVRSAGIEPMRELPEWALPQMPWK